MSLLDYSSPDIVFGDADIVASYPDDTETVVVLALANSRRLIAIRVHGRRSSKSHIMNCRYYTWDCTHPKDGRECGYAPGHEDMPPIPEQRCHNCRGLRAEHIPNAERVRADASVHRPPTR